MANGTPDTSVIDNKSIDDFLGPQSPGEVAAQQASQSQQPSFISRYTDAAAGGALAVSPFAGAEVALAPGPGWIPAAATLGIGAAGGVVHQATEDLTRGTPAESWAPTAADIAFGLGTGGLGFTRQIGSNLLSRLPASVSALAAHPVSTGIGGALGAIGLDHFASSILGSIPHAIASPQGMATAAATFPLMGVARAFAQRSWRSIAQPVEATIGGWGGQADQWIRNQLAP